MSEPTITRTDDVFLLDFGAGENATSDAWVSAVHDRLDEFDAADGPKALVTTGSAKHYSNGLDVAYMATIDGPGVADYVERVLGVVRRIMLLGAPTIAAVNGHAFGMGAFLVLAHDQAVMREDRGFICFPEVHIGMSFPEPLLEIARFSLPPRSLRQALSSGHRYSGPQAVAAGMVDEVCSLDTLRPRATDMVSPLAATASSNLAEIKRQILPTIAARVAT